MADLTNAFIKILGSQDKNTPLSKMTEKVAKTDNPTFVSTVYGSTLNDNLSKNPANGNFNQLDMDRTAKTLDDYNAISDAVKLLINELNLKSKK